MELTVFGIVTDVRPLQLMKALLPMEVTGSFVPEYGTITLSGMTRFPIGLTKFPQPLLIVGDVIAIEWGL